MKHLILFLLLLPAYATAQVERPPQYVSLAFDGSKSTEMWKSTLDFAARNDVKFTYFVSSVYFIDNGNKRTYVAPKLGAGKSAIGFGGTAADIKARNSWMEKAIAQGHEMAGHANGHFDGGKWSLTDWLNELAQFQLFMFEAPNYGGVKNLKLWDYAYSNPNFGFRAPQLGHNANMFKALKSSGYKYDTSKIKRMDQWPVKNSEGLWEFALAGIKLSRSGKSTASMDYNLYVAQSGGVKGNSKNFQAWEDEVFETYMNYFKNNYLGNRAPIDIGHHFSLWNGGIYWNAMQRFAQTVCNLPEVVCGTYQDLLSFVEKKSSSTLNAYQAGNFKKMSSNAMPAILHRTSTVNHTGELNAKELDILQHQLCPPEAHDEDSEEIKFVPSLGTLEI